MPDGRGPDATTAAGSDVAACVAVSRSGTAVEVGAGVGARGEAVGAAASGESGAVAGAPPVDATMKTFANDNSVTAGTHLAHPFARAGCLSVERGYSVTRDALSLLPDTASIEFHAAVVGSGQPRIDGDLAR